MQPDDTNDARSPRDDSRETPGPPDHMEEPGRGTESGARHGADSDGDPADESIPPEDDRTRGGSAIAQDET